MYIDITYKYSLLESGGLNTAGFPCSAAPPRGALRIVAFRGSAIDNHEDQDEGVEELGHKAGTCRNLKDLKGRCCLDGFDG